MQLNMTGLYTKLYAITDHTPCDVDTPKRFGAYILDWVVGGIFTGLPAVLLYSGLSKKQDMFGGLYVFESLGYARSWAFLAGALSLPSNSLSFNSPPLMLKTCSAVLNGKN